MLADRFEGRRLNSPNDVVVASDGAVWFTDPTYGIDSHYEGHAAPSEIGASNVYRVDPGTGAVALMVADIPQPNGLAFSPDEALLYVAETGGQFDPEPTQHIRVFDVVEGGTSLSGGRVFHTVAPGNSDGFRVDEGGNLWTSAGDGVHCISPGGDLLGKIKVPSTVANVAFGGRNRAELFICASHTLYAIYTNVRGAQRP